MTGGLRVSGDELGSGRRCRVGRVAVGGRRCVLDAGGMASADRRRADSQRRGGTVRRSLAHIRRRQRQTVATAPVHCRGPSLLHLEGTSIVTYR